MTSAPAAAFAGRTRDGRRFARLDSSITLGIFLQTSVTILTQIAGDILLLSSTSIMGDRRFDDECIGRDQWLFS